MESIDALGMQLYAIVLSYGPRLLGAIITLVIGWWIIKVVLKLLKKNFEKMDMEPSLRGFLMSILGITLKILLLISVIGMIGVQMTSFIAILGAAGLAVGMALSGTLHIARDARYPMFLALCKAAQVSAVSPDCEIVTNKVFGATLTSR